MNYGTNGWIYIAAWNASQPNIPICCTGMDELEEGEIEVMVEDDRDTPESVLLKKDAFESLSSEAKYLLDIILNTPKEFAGMLYTPRYMKTSASKVKHFLRTQLHWNNIKVNRVFKEIKTYIREV